MDNFPLPEWDIYKHEEVTFKKPEQKPMDKGARLRRLHFDLTWLMQSFDITLEQRDLIDEVCWIVHEAKSGKIEEREWE